MLRSHLVLAIGVVLGTGLLADVAFAAPKGPKKPSPAKEEASGSFDRGAAVSAIETADLAKCRTTNTSKGDGHVTLTFQPSGSASNVAVDRGPWVGTPVAKCLSQQFKKVKVPAFKGDAVTVGKSFRID